MIFHLLNLHTQINQDLELEIRLGRKNFQETPFFYRKIIVYFCLLSFIIFPNLKLSFQKFFLYILQFIVSLSNLRCFFQTKDQIKRSIF